MTTQNLPASLTHLMTGLQATHARVKAIAGGAGEQYLKLTKGGLWVYGAEEIDVQENSAWAVDPNSFMAGFIAWEPDPNKPAEKLGEEMRAATDSPIDKATLPDVGGPWDEQLAMTMLCLTGEDKGTRVIYNTTSKGGLRAINDTLGAIVQRLNEGETDAIIPVVVMEVDSYQHKRYGKVYVPMLRVVRWESLSNTPEAAGEQLEHSPPEAEPEKREALPPEQEQAPPEQEQAPPPPVAEDAPPPPQPSRRRRRRAAA